MNYRRVADAGGRGLPKSAQDVLRIPEAVREDDVADDVERDIVDAVGRDAAALLLDGLEPDCVRAAPGKART